MAMTPREIERKMSQLDNDVQEIYAMLGAIAATQQRQGNRLAEHTLLLEGHTARLDGIDGRLDGIDVLLQGLTDSMSEVLRRLPG